MDVHIADDSQIIIEGFKSLLLQYNINIVGTSNNGLEVIEWLKNNTADVVILDISMPLKNGIEVVEYLNENKIDQKVIIVSGFLQFDFIRNTVGKGAQGFVSKQFASLNIIDALNVVYNGGTYFSIDVQELLIKECLNFDQNSNSEFASYMLGKSLSKQEMNILLLHAKNYNSSEISEELNIKKSTIRTYTARIRDKLNLDSKIGWQQRLKQFKNLMI
ncbi:response regulator transcription factor [uncultured Tenacibaculum sp.]|uniref:response regulator n=1 Tax=uncultured Tenacibaculum sp. TaxID=174713 RepID=UPI00261B1461|nr:response regulator transcription factor [uncultured Tenacibaculum sp.]